MNYKLPINPHSMNRCLLALLTLVPFTATPAQSLQLTPAHPDGVFVPGQPIVWNVTVDGDAAALGHPHYVIKLNGGPVIDQGTLDLTIPGAHIETKAPAEPAAVLAELTATGPDQKDLKALGGAVVSPEKIHTIVERPADFDAFWKTKIAELAKIPANPVLVPSDSGNPAVDYFQLTLDNIGGKKIHAQIARPKAGAKFPGVVILQWAGVYGLPKSFVVGRAAQGWLAIDVMAHDLPIDESPEFYKQQSAGPLKSYFNIGDESRDTSYFLAMMLGDVRVAEYLRSRPDWDGKTLVANGGSQGGYQSVVLAGLDPQITAVVCEIPAGCEMTSSAAGRASGWPAWPVKSASDPHDAAIIATSRYFDTVNFAPLVRVPTLVGLGLIDITCPPSGVLSMFNQLNGPKEHVFFPLMGHKGPHPAYEARAKVWLDALLHAQPVPPKS